MSLVGILLYNLLIEKYKWIDICNTQFCFGKVLSLPQPLNKMKYYDIRRKKNENTRVSRNKE